MYSILHFNKVNNGLFYDVSIGYLTNNDKVQGIKLLIFFDFLKDLVPNLVFFLDTSMQT